MQNLETIKEILKKEFGEKHFLGSDEYTDEIADWWLNKMQAREEELWQKLEEKRIEIGTGHYCLNCLLNRIIECGCSDFNQALSDAQSLLDVEK